MRQAEASGIDVVFATHVAFATTLGHASSGRGPARKPTDTREARPTHATPRREAEEITPAFHLHQVALDSERASSPARRAKVTSMLAPNFQLGDLVFSRHDLFNDDDGIPDVAPGELLAAAGTRGVVVKIGHAEARPEIAIYLVRFEGANKELGPPVGCLAEELTQEELRQE